LPFGLKRLIAFLARTMRIPLSISPHKNTDLIFIDRLENPSRIFDKNDLWQNWDSEFCEGMGFCSASLHLEFIYTDHLFGIIGTGYYFFRSAIRMSQYSILTHPYETVLPSGTQSSIGHDEIGFFCRSILRLEIKLPLGIMPSEGNTFSRRNEIRKMKILLSVGGIGYPLVSAEGGGVDQQNFISDGIELYNSQTLSIRLKI
jgi:hypothetical protein